MQQSVTTIAFASRVLGNIGAPLHYGASESSEESDEVELDASSAIMLGLPVKDSENIEMVSSPGILSSGSRDDAQSQAVA